MFNEFKSGEKGHMAFVQEVNTVGDGDPFYETIGNKNGYCCLKGVPPYMVMNFTF